MNSSRIRRMRMGSPEVRLFTIDSRNFIPCSGSLARTSRAPGSRTRSGVASPPLRRSSPANVSNGTVAV